MAVHQRGCSVCAFFYEDSVDTRSQNFSYLRLFKRMGVCGCVWLPYHWDSLQGYL